MSNTHEIASDVTTPVALLVRNGGQDPQFLPVEHDGFTIGSDGRCDLTLDQADWPRLHSVIHVQGRAVWIEALHDEAQIRIGTDAFRRRALRDGDCLTFGETEVEIRLGETSVAAARAELAPKRRVDEDISLLSAEELCDRIEQEERLIDEFELGRRRGFAALVAAMREILHEEVQETIPLADEALGGLVAQVRGLSETLGERTKALSAQEAHLIESSSQLCDAQVRIGRQLEKLIERLGHDDEPGELRVSA